MIKQFLFFASVASAALVATSPVAAQSGRGWERVHDPRVLGGQIGDNCGNAILQASAAAPLIVATGAIFTVDIVGHGIDIGSAVPTIDGVNGERISGVRRYGGLENSRRSGCGPIGSIRLNIAIPETLTADTNATLRIGTGVSVPMRIVTRQRLTGTEWSTVNLQSTGSTAVTVAPPPTPPTPQPATCIVSVPFGTNCNGVMFLGPSGSTAVSSGPTFSQPVLSCIADLIGSAARISGNDLFLTLPDNRATAVARGCFERNLPIRVSRDYAVGVGPGIHFRAATGEGIIVELPFMGGGTLRANSFTPRTATLPEDRAINVIPGATLASAVVGQVRIPITVRNPSGGQTRTLNLILQSATAFGVERLELNPLTKSALAIRTNLLGNRNVAVRFHLFPTETRGDYHWALEPLAQGNPTRCFTQTNGTFTPSVATERSFDISLTRTGAAGCAGTSVTLVAWSGPTGNRSLPLYRRTLTVPAN